MTAPTNTRTTSPNGTLLQWKLGRAETGEAVPIIGKSRPTVHVEGEFYGAEVRIVGAQAPGQTLVPIIDRDGDDLLIDSEAVAEIPASPAYAAPEVSGGTEETALIITIFLPD